MNVLVHAMQLHALQKQPSLKLKTQPKQLLGYILLADSPTSPSPAKELSKRGATNKLQKL
jgi:hypothetical protein